jgi:hypothetical protein
MHSPACVYSSTKNAPFQASSLCFFFEHTDDDDNDDAVVWIEG